MNQLKAGVVLSYVIIILNMMITVSYSPYKLRMLGQSEYGMYSLAASLVAYLTLFDLGFGNTIVRYTAKYRAEGKVTQQYEMFGMFQRMYWCIAIIVLSIGIYLAIYIDTFFSSSMNTHELATMRNMVLLMSFNLAFSFSFCIYGSIITAYQNFIFQKIVNIVRVILNPLVMILFLHMGYKATTMIVITTIFNIITLAINYWYCHHKLKIIIIFGKFDASFLKEILGYSFWIFLNAVMERFYWNTGQFILGITQGTVVVAIYSLALMLKDMFYTFSTAITGVFLPKVSAMVAQNVSGEELSRLFIRVGRIQFIIISLIISGFIVFGRSFISYWAGEGYDDSYIIALLLFVTTMIPLIQNLGVTILQAKNQLRFRSILYVIVSAISVLIAIPLSQLYGGIGCAWAIAIGVILAQCVIINIYYAKVVHLQIVQFWLQISKMAIIPLIMVLLSFFVLHYYPIESISELLYSIALFVLSYIPLFWAFSMNKEERELFEKPLVNIYQKAFIK